MYICNSKSIKKSAMKKFLSLLSIVCLVAFVSNAQEPQKKAATTETAVAADAEVEATSTEAPAAKKACCSSAKGAKACSSKEKAACDHSSKAKSKASCSHGSKAEAAVDKNEVATPNNK